MSTYRFSHLNNMKPNTQPLSFRNLTQVEEMFIACVNPILQVTHACGCQYKYNDHTINFPQDITTIVNYSPQMVSKLDIIIVKRQNSSKKDYKFFACKSR